MNSLALGFPSLRQPLGVTGRGSSVEMEMALYYKPRPR